MTLTPAVCRACCHVTITVTFQLVVWSWTCCWRWAQLMIKSYWRDSEGRSGRRNYWSSFWYWRVHRRDVFMTDDGGDGDYLHSVLGMHYVSFVPVYSSTTCTRGLLSDVFWHIYHCVVSSFFMTIILYSGFLSSHFPPFILMAWFPVCY